MRNRSNWRLEQPGSHRQIAHRRQYGELATCISLMYASDYPHSDARKKLLWDNASRFFKQT